MHLLVLADCPPMPGLTTGFGRVAAHLCQALVDGGHQVAQMAINYHQQQSHGYPWQLIPTIPKDYLGNDQLVKLLKRFKPDAVLGFNDIWVCNRWFAIAWSSAKAAGLDPVPFLGYFPVDCAGYEPQLVKSLPYWAGVATYTQFGKGVLAEAGYRGNCAVIPHGVEPVQSVEPMALPAQLKDAWIVLRTDINRPRKRYDLTIQAFCEFAKDKPLPPTPGAPVLWLHCADFGDDLPVREYYERCLTKTGTRFEQRPLMRSQVAGHNQHPFCSDQTLASIYAAASCYLQTSDAEGWGLCPVEASQHGALVIAGNHSVHGELWRDCAVLVDPVDSRAESFGLLQITTQGKPIQVRSALEYPVVTTAGYVEALEVAYSHAPLVQQLKANAAQRWAEPRFQWPVIEAQFRGWLDRALCQ